jgi:hypothetical protein
MYLLVALMVSSVLVADIVLAQRYIKPVQVAQLSLDKPTKVTLPDKYVVRSIDGKVYTGYKVNGVFIAPSKDCVGLEGVVCDNGVCLGEGTVICPVSEAVMRGDAENDIYVQGTVLVEAYPVPVPFFGAGIMFAAVMLLLGGWLIGIANVLNGKVANIIAIPTAVVTGTASQAVFISKLGSEFTPLAVAAVAALLGIHFIVSKFK